MENSLTLEGKKVAIMGTVLILILMEYSLTFLKRRLLKTSSCLNPYFNGILSDHRGVLTTLGKVGLNPYSNGILSDSS